MESYFFCYRIYSPHFAAKCALVQQWIQRACLLEGMMAETRRKSAVSMYILLVMSRAIKQWQGPMKCRYMHGFVYDFRKPGAYLHPGLSLSSCWPPGHKPRQLCLISHILTYLYKDMLSLYKDLLDLVLSMPSYLAYLLSFSRKSKSVIQTHKMKLFKF